MSVFERRLRACQDALAEHGADGVVLFPSPNTYYVSGFQEEPDERHLFLMVSQQGAGFVAPAMYDEQICETSWLDDVRTWSDGEDPMVPTSELVDELDIVDGHVLVDDQMWALFTQDLQETFPEMSFGLASEVFDTLRMCKDERELGALREAAHVSDHVSEEVRVMGTEVVGMSETELAQEIERQLTDVGGEALSFEVIVGSGPNGAQPHHRHSDREIQAGEPVVLDFGARVDGYPGDQTRTVVFDGDPPAGFEAAYDTVLAAFEAGVETVEPGIEAQEVDRAVRATIEDRGYGEQFFHRTGHGLGLNVHEAPYIVEGNNTPLEPGDGVQHRTRGLR